MKVLILAAMDKELSLLENLLESPAIKDIASVKIISGRIENHEIYLGKCGIGKVNSALNSYRLIQTLNPDMLLNSGVAGGAGLKIGSVLIADRIAYSDVWCGPGTIYGQADGLPLYLQPSEKILEISEKIILENKYEKLEKGLICSGDRFITSAEEIDFIRNKFPEVKAVDMESAAIAHTCFLMNVPFGVIRVVSDTPGEGENITQYKNFWEDAPKRTFNILKEIIENL